MVKVALLVAAVAVVAVSSCVSSSEVTAQLGRPGPPQPAGCSVALFPARTPDYPFVDIARVHADCYETLGRAACVEELHKRACALGGDTLYGFTDEETHEWAGINAVVARRDRAAPVAPPAPNPCEPPCSPGFACQAAVCVPQCNPACEAGEVCNRHRSCEPAAHAARP